MWTFKRLTFITFLLAITVYFFISSKNTSQTQLPESRDKKLELLSQELGYELWSKIKLFKQGHILEEVITGMRACEAGSSPISPETLNELEYTLFEEQAEENRKKAEAFLENVAKSSSIFVCEPNHLYYEIKRHGTGKTLSSAHIQGLFHYKVSTHEKEELFSTYDEENPREITIDETIEGFSKGVLGMKENEQRTIYIHPSLAYGKSGWHVPANSLIILDVELIKIL